MKDRGSWSRQPPCIGAGTTYSVELHVQAAGVAHGLTLCVAAPQRGGGGLAVGAGQAHPAGSRLQHRRQTLQVQGKGSAAAPVSGGVLRGWALPTWVLGADHKNPVGASQTSGSPRASLYLSQPWGGVGVGAGKTCCGSRRVTPNCGFSGTIGHSMSQGNPSGHWAL